MSGLLLIEVKRFSPDSDRIADSQRDAEQRFGRGGCLDTLDTEMAL